MEEGDSDREDDNFEIGFNDLESEVNQSVLKSNDLASPNDRLLATEKVDPENDVEQITDSDHDGIPNNNENTIDAADDIDPTKKSHLEPVEGMEFDSYDDAYSYYNCYAKALGFGIRVKSSWTKRSSKEKRGAVLCCNCEGFKVTKEGSAQRKETRTGCQALIRLRMLESNRWRLDEVRLEHNHTLDCRRVQNSKSHKKIDDGTTKGDLDSIVDIQVQTIKLYRTNTKRLQEDSNAQGFANHLDRTKLGKHELRSLSAYFRDAQLADTNFFYVMDLNDEGILKNVFWVDSRSRASYRYFGDVVLVCRHSLSDKHDENLIVSFSGLNHHEQPLLLGCSLLADETNETYIWLLRTWLTCISGCPPQALITDRCKTLEYAVSEVVPRARHCLYLPLVIKSIQENLEEIGDSEIFQTMVDKTVYNSMKVEEFELGWDQMVRNFAISDHEWLKSLYDEREKWVPAYLKDAFFAGILHDFTNITFHGYLSNQSALDRFFNTYESLREKQIQKESLDDSDSKSFRPVLRTCSNYEQQLSQLYTKEIFLKFQEEVLLMSNCYNITQIHVNGSITTYMIKERDLEGDSRNFEVMYDKDVTEVRCMCSCFNFRGYLCRHALSVLNYVGLEEIPNMYILSRWRKDVKRLYGPDLDSDKIDVSNPVQRSDHLYKHAIRVVAEGTKSEERYMVALQAFQESVNKVRSVGDKSV